jgi:enoyl-[acyl-carrier protein] reductase I
MFGGIVHFDEMRGGAAAPEQQLVDIEDVGTLVAFLVSGAWPDHRHYHSVDGWQHAIA